MRAGLFVVALLLLAANVRAEEYTPVWPPQYQQLANVASYGMAGASIGADLYHAFKQQDRAHALKQFGLRNGVTIGVSEVVKRVTHRKRPNGSDNLSFWSEHTALTAAASGYSVQINIPLVFGVADTRMGAGAHHPTDTIFGALFGGIMAAVFR